MSGRQPALRRWSKLQKQIYNLIDSRLDFQLHCRSYRMNSQRGSTELPRYWIQIGGEMIWDYPRQFSSGLTYYPYQNDISAISDLLREYIDMPIVRLLDARFENDRWGLTDILKACDRRISPNRLEAKFAELSGTAQRVLHARINHHGDAYRTAR